MKDEDFVSRTINDGSLDMDKFPASKVCQLAKKMESSKTTVRHIRQVASDPQAAQINLMHHQHTELPSGKNKERKQGVKPKQSHHKNAEHPPSGQYKRNFDPKLAHKYKDRCPNVVTLLIWRDFNVQPRNFNAKLAINLDILRAFAIRKINRNMHPASLGSQRHINGKQVLYMCKTILIAINQEIQAQMTNSGYSTPKQVSSKSLHPPI